MGDCLSRLTQVAMYDAYAAAKLISVTCFASTDDITPTPELTFDQINEPQGDWYAQLTFTPDQMFLNDSGNLEVRGTSVQWNRTGTDPTETVFCAGVLDSDGNISSMQRLPESHVMANDLDSCPFQPKLEFPPINQS